jgi:hypothetical protein
LLTPISLSTFISEHWERHPLYVERGDAAYYQPAFSLDDLEAS